MELIRMFTKSDKPCLSPDSFVAVYSDSNPLWTVYLSNGEVCYQDDNRPGMHRNSWMRVKKYCYDNDIDVVRVKFRFAGYEYMAFVDEDLETEGVYFSRGASALLTETSNRTWDLYVIGSIHWPFMDVVKYEVPTLGVHASHRRDIVESNEQIIIYHRKWRNVREKVYFPEHWSGNNGSSVHSGDSMLEEVQE